MSEKAVKSRILVVDDEPEIVSILAAYLNKSGYDVISAPDGVTALSLHASGKPDLVLLDIQMPEKDGWQVLSEIRANYQTPVIMLTAMDQDIDKLTGLRIGADDYIVKPFNPAEVVARVSAVLRRTMTVADVATSTVISIPPLEINTDDFTVKVKTLTYEGLLQPTLTEFRILLEMARKPSKVFTRSTLLEQCLPENETLERTVDSHISKLRKKLEKCGVEGFMVGVRGVGYKLCDKK
ncbi:response regulator [Alteromonas sp. RKMC-009]|uniref:response regulator n=1 Tax=Alteromonas sp. RKMC-009 TaxID=2267264 RepID=UPI000E69B4FB|nr:response regulator [Alteromonas sp. RKMC-009]AYA62771.1 response regulator transcription factor [Alteromonas sp. RKMC-009]